MALSNVQSVALGSFLVAVVFGAIGNKTNFCTMGAVSDWVLLGDKNRLRAWLLAAGVAILGTQFLPMVIPINLNKAIYLTTNFSWLGHILGGLFFGIGMTLAGGCGQRTLVRVGGGNLKSIVVLLMIGITAYMTLRGLLAPVRINLIEVTNIDLKPLKITDQGIPTLIMALTGITDAPLVRWAVTAVFGLGFVVFAFSSAEFRRSLDNMLAGIGIGLIVVAGWFITAKLGFDEFEPARIESYSFVAPVGESLNYLMTYTGSTINFGIAAAFGIVLGSFLYAVLSGKFRIETFTRREDMIGHIVGGMLMGFGGVVALGCTIGQGVTGFSTLALGSVITLSCIIFGAALTMKVQYHMMDEIGFIKALRTSLSEFRLWPTPGKPS